MIERIEAKAFQTSGLTEYIVPDGVKVIGQEAFNSCYELTSVTFCPGIAKIEEHAFSTCEKLHKVILKEGLLDVKANAFAHSGIRHIVFPKGIRSLGDEMFLGCEDLISVAFANATDDIQFGKDMFYFYGTSKPLRYVRYGPDTIEVPPRAFVRGGPEEMYGSNWEEWDATKFVTVEARQIALRSVRLRRFASLLFTFDRLSDRTKPCASDPSVDYYAYPNLRFVYKTKGRNERESPRYLLCRVLSFL